MGEISREMNRLRGRLCGAVESWGLDERRERAMITLLKSLTYDAEKAINESVQRVKISGSDECSSASTDG